MRHTTPEVPCRRRDPSGPAPVSPMSSTETFVKLTIATSTIYSKSRKQKTAIRPKPHHNGGLPESRGGVPTAAHRYKFPDHVLIVSCSCPLRRRRKLPPLFCFFSHPRIDGPGYTPCLGRPHDTGMPPSSSRTSDEVKTSPDNIDVTTAQLICQMHVVCTPWTAHRTPSWRRDILIILVDPS